MIEIQNVCKLQNILWKSDNKLIISYNISMLAFEQRVVLNSIRNMGMRKKRKGRIFYTRKKKDSNGKKIRTKLWSRFFPFPGRPQTEYLRPVLQVSSIAVGVRFHQTKTIPTSPLLRAHNEDRGILQIKICTLWPNFRIVSVFSARKFR